MTVDEWLTLIALLLALQGAQAGFVAWLWGQINGLRTENRGDTQRLNEKEGIDIGSVRLELDTKVNALDDKSRKAAHDLANLTQVSVGTLQQQLNQLRDASATKPELIAVEVRLVASIVDLKTETRNETNKLGVKVDNMREQLAGMTAQMTNLTVMITKIGDHIQRQSNA